MAEKFIEEIYRYANTISKQREVVERFRYDEDFCGIGLFQEQVPELAQLLESCVEDGYVEADILQEKLYSIQGLRDITVIADMLEQTVIPIMERWIQSWVSVDEQVDARYRIESTACGFLTIKDTQSNRYLHSNNDPMNEARKIVEKEFGYEKESYIVWGCGLGYHVYQLYLISGGTIPITVYEPNPNLIRYALQYGVLSWIPEGNLQIMAGYSAEEFLQNIKSTDGVFLLKPYVCTMQNECRQKLLLEYMAREMPQEKIAGLGNASEVGNGAEETCRHAYTISRLRQVVDYIRIMYVEAAEELLRNIWRDAEQLSRACVGEEYGETEELETALSAVSEMQDPILRGDVLENAVIPAMERWMQSKGSVEKVLDGRYMLESAANGFLTIRDVSANIYLHSKQDPMDEARKLIERQYNNTCSRYVVWGCGLGYYIYQLYRITEGKIPIIVYETNPNMIQYAEQYGVLSWIPTEILQIVLVEDVEEFFAALQEQDGTTYLNAYITANDDKEQRNRLRQRFSRFIFQFEGAHNLKLNYYKNRRSGLPYVSEIDHAKLNKEMVIIGGGPSVDHFMDTLKAWQGKKTLIAAGTVWKKLLKAGIRPDFVVIMDPYDIVVPQVEGIEDTSATLLLAMQANWKIANCYQGKKYLIPQSISTDESEAYMEKNGLIPWFAGGSVTVYELEFTVRMFADRVYLVGVDLSLPGGMTHAEGTRYRKQVDVTNLIPQEDVNGNTVYTDYVLIESKAWFEMVMAETEGIEFVNMSDVGVKLKGTIPYKGRPDKT